MKKKLKRLLRQTVGPYILGQDGGWQFPDNMPRELHNKWHQVQAQGLTFLRGERIETLLRQVLRLEAEGIEGTIIETGCARGGSAILMCLAKDQTRRLEVYDVFEMIPEPSDNDPASVHERYAVIKSGKAQGINGSDYYGYETGLYDQVAQSFHAFGAPPADNNTHLIKGLVQDTVRGDEPVALAHIDVDWYDPVTTCLERIIPRLAPGGVVVIDDYLDWESCRSAVNDYFQREGRSGLAMVETAGHLIIGRAH